MQRRKDINSDIVSLNPNCDDCVYRREIGTLGPCCNYATMVHQARVVPVSECNVKLSKRAKRNGKRVIYYHKVCEACGEEFIANAARTKYCPACKRELGKR
jgi:predicted Zn-ribbon and HTH transcriptional regulator